MTLPVIISEGCLQEESCISQSCSITQSEPEFDYMYCVSARQISTTASGWDHEMEFHGEVVLVQMLLGGELRMKIDVE